MNNDGDKNYNNPQKRKAAVRPDLLLKGNIKIASGKAASFRKTSLFTVFMQEPSVLKAKEVFSFPTAAGEYTMRRKK